MAFKVNITLIACLVLVACISPVFCGGGGGGDQDHKSLSVNVPYHVHTIHHHHISKYPVYKKIEVPVIKEIKVPYPVHYAVKVPYPVIVKPYIVTVPVHHYPVHKEEHVTHHKQSEQHEQHHDESEQSHGGSGKWF
ncbi:unnamed protein product [Diamesa serratosioi]